MSAQLKRDLDMIQRVLLEEKRAKVDYGKLAFDTLMPKQQEKVLLGERIVGKYIQRAIEWEKQPEHVKAKSSFYELYQSHSNDTKHSCLIHEWITPEDDALVDEAWHILFVARKKVDPRYRTGGIH